MKLSRLRFISLLSCTMLSLAACSKDTDDLGEQKSEKMEVLYNRGQDQMGEKSFKEAVKSFEEVERQYPYSPWATRAQIMGAYSAYKAGDYDQAIPMLERFVRMHPGDDQAPYAYYLIALCNYEQISDVGRDQKMTGKALQSLTEVIKRFPSSEYARDAKLKLDLTYDHLAGKEMQVGRYYLGRDEYLAAINRFRDVVENYQMTSHTPEALHRLVECYLKLGIADEAKRYAAVLGENFPASYWYKQSYALLTAREPEKKEESGWMSRLLP